MEETAFKNIKIDGALAAGSLEAPVTLCPEHCLPVMLPLITTRPCFPSARMRASARGREASTCYWRTTKTEAEASTSLASALPCETPVEPPSANTKVPLPMSTLPKILVIFGTGDKRKHSFVFVFFSINTSSLSEFLSILDKGTLHSPSNKIHFSL